MNKKGVSKKGIKNGISVFLVIIFTSFIFISQYCVNIKPDISSVATDQKIAAFIKPAVVRVFEGYAITLKYNAPSNTPYIVDQIINNYVKELNSSPMRLWYGSGAIINPDGYIVTNAHVVEYVKMEDSQVIDMEYHEIGNDLSKLLAKQGYNLSADILYNFAKQFIGYENFSKIAKVRLPGGELADYDIKSYGAPIGEGKDVAVIKIDKKNLPSILLGDSSKLALQENISAFGYPGAADSALLSNESSLVVSINSGKISATDKKSYQGAPVLQVDVSVQHGSSGGPIVNSDGTLVGLITFTSENNSNSTPGFNFAVPVDTVKEFVNQAGAKNEEGQVNKLYKEGLILYWGGYYKDALKDFEAVQRLYSGHSEIEKLISECQQKSNDSKILWSNYKQPALVIDILLFITVIVLLGFTIRSFIISKKRKNSVTEEDSIKTSIGTYDSLNNTNTTSTQQRMIINKVDTNLENSKVQLVCIFGILKDTKYNVGSEPIIFGRDIGSCKVIFPSDYTQISRKHCILKYDEGKNIFILKDLGSATGTFTKLNEKLNVNEEVTLHSGDTFYLGSNENLFELWIENK